MNVLKSKCDWANRTKTTSNQEGYHVVRQSQLQDQQLQEDTHMQVCAMASTERAIALTVGEGSYDARVAVKKSVPDLSTAECHQQKIHHKQTNTRVNICTKIVIV